MRSSTSWSPSARSRARPWRPSSSSARTGTRATFRCSSTSRTVSSRSRRTRSSSGWRPTSAERSSSRSTAATGARTCPANFVLREQDSFGLLVSDGNLSAAGRSRSIRAPSSSAAARVRSRPGIRGNQVPRTGERGSSSPTYGGSSPVTASAESTGARPLAAASSGSRDASGTELGRRHLPRHLPRGAGAPRRGRSTAPVRAAASLVEPYLERKDRVGFVAFGGVTNWLTVVRARCSSTASSTRCSTPRSSSATRGRTST